MPHMIQQWNNKHYPKKICKHSMILSLIKKNEIPQLFLNSAKFNQLQHVQSSCKDPQNQNTQKESCCIHQIDHKNLKIVHFVISNFEVWHWQQYWTWTDFRIVIQLDYSIRSRIQCHAKFLACEISNFTPCTHEQRNVLHIKYAEKTDD